MPNYDEEHIFFKTAKFVAYCDDGFDPLERLKKKGNRPPSMLGKELEPKFSSLCKNLWDADNEALLFLRFAWLIYDAQVYDKEKYMIGSDAAKKSQMLFLANHLMKGNRVGYFIKEVQINLGLDKKINDPNEEEIKESKDSIWHQTGIAYYDVMSSGFFDSSNFSKEYLDQMQPRRGEPQFKESVHYSCKDDYSNVVRFLNLLGNILIAAFIIKIALFTSLYSSLFLLSLFPIWIFLIQKLDEKREAYFKFKEKKITGAAWVGLLVDAIIAKKEEWQQVLQKQDDENKEKIKAYFLSDVSEIDEIIFLKHFRFLMFQRNNPNNEPFFIDPTFDKDFYCKVARKVFPLILKNDIALGASLTRHCKKSCKLISEEFNVIIEPTHITGQVQEQYNPFPLHILSEEKGKESAHSIRLEKEYRDREEKLKEDHRLLQESLDSRWRTFHQMFAQSREESPFDKLEEKCRDEEEKQKEEKQKEVDSLPEEDRAKRLKASEEAERAKRLKDFEDAEAENLAKVREMLDSMRWFTSQF